MVGAYDDLDGAARTLEVEAAWLYLEFKRRLLYSGGSQGTVTRFIQFQCRECRRSYGAGRD
jgi:hypothetical protein